MEKFHRLHERERVKTSYDNAHCGVIALELAKVMISEGKRPYMTMVYEETSEPSEEPEKETDFLFSRRGKTTVTQLVPLAYASKMEPWHAHSVICLDGWAFDPILEEPVLMKEYTKDLFGKKIATKIQMTAEEVEAQVHPFE